MVIVTDQKGKKDECSDITFNFTRNIYRDETVSIKSEKGYKTDGGKTE